MFAFDEELVPGWWCGYSNPNDQLIRHVPTKNKVNLIKLTDFLLFVMVDDVIKTSKLDVRFVDDILERLFTSFVNNRGCF